MIRSGRFKLQVFRYVVLLAAALFFLVPMFASIEFSTRGNGIAAPRTLDSWKLIASTPELSDAIIASLELAVITSVMMLVLLLPTMVWVRLRLPLSEKTSSLYAAAVSPDARRLGERQEEVYP